MVTAPRILLAEDNHQMRAILAWSLEHEGYEVVECSTGFELLDRLGRYILDDGGEPFELIISDVRMPGLTGLEVLEAASQTQGFPPMILITAFGDEDTHAQALRLGAIAFLDKPFEIDELITAVRAAAPR